MSTNLFDRMREGLQVQKKNLEDWLSNTPVPTKQLRLGPQTETKVTEHLHTLEAAISKTEDKTLGLCDVCHDYIEATRLEMDYTACVCLEHMTGEQKSRLEEELELSQKVQKALLPHKIPDVKGLQLAVFSQPAQIVGGDYFDFFEHKDGRFGFAVGDVMGKGMPASLLMANLQASLRILVNDHETPDQVMDRLNCLLVHNIRLTKFVTLFLAKFNKSNRTLTYTNAGHNPPLLLRNDHEALWLRPTGAAVGLIENSEFQSATVQLRPGDLLVFYTDGVTETHNAEEDEFGDERLLQIAKDHINAAPQELVKVLRDRLREFGGTKRPEDDTTLMVIRVQ